MEVQPRPSTTVQKSLHRKDEKCAGTFNLDLKVMVHNDEVLHSTLEDG